MSLNDYRIGSSSRGYGQFDENGQPRGQNYGKNQPHRSSIRDIEIKGTYQYSSDRSTMEPTPLHPNKNNSIPLYQSNGNPLSSFASFLTLGDQPSHPKMQDFSSTRLGLPADNSFLSTRSQSGTPNQSQYYPASESRSREVFNPPNDERSYRETSSQNYQLPASAQRSDMKYKGNEHMNFMQPSSARVSNSMWVSPFSSVRPERELGASSSRWERKDHTRRRRNAIENSKSYISGSVMPTQYQPPSQDYSRSLQDYPPPFQSAYGIEENSHQREEPPGSEKKCRLPECKMWVSENAPFGACRAHCDQLSNWDFSYCEAEKRNIDSLADFFPNGQCKNKKMTSSFLFCPQHSIKGHPSRKIFLRSNGREGKWFEGRNVGTADLPPGYGTSGSRSYYNKQQVHLPITWPT